MIISRFYSASDSPDGGIFLLELDDSLDLRHAGKLSLPHTQWTEARGGLIEAIFRDPGLGDGYARFSCDGKMLGEAYRTRGENVCHFISDGDDVYLAHYKDGTIEKLGGEAFIQSGDGGPNKSRQSGPHAHQCIFSPDKKRVLCCDLGLDAVIVYDRELREVSRAHVPPGHGVRHAVFSPDGNRLYTVSELGSSISVFDWDGNTLSLISTHDMLEGERRGDGAEITVSRDGKHIYATNRSSNGTPDCICHFLLDGEVRLVSRTPSMGNHPRHFTFIADERYAVCSNTFEGSLTLFKTLPDGELEFMRSYPFPSPMCVCEAE